MLDSPSHLFMRSHVKANLERGAACLMCRKRKQRCDGVKPICGGCTRSKGRVDCVYRATRRQRLEQQIRDLESRIAAAEAASSSEHNTTTSASVAGSLDGSTPGSAHDYKTSGAIVLPMFAGRSGLHALPSLRLPQQLSDPDMVKPPGGPVPQDVRTYLISLFLQFRWRHPFEFNISRLLFALELPPTHPNAPHPALVNAVLLNGCFFAESTFHKYEPSLMICLRRSIQHSLATADRLFDCMRALALFSCYLNNKCRMVESHYYLAGAMNLAIACGLNTINSLDLSAQTSSLLKPAADLVELGDRINFFWMLYITDRTGPLLGAGIACGPADDDISTVWPCPSDHYEDGCVCFQHSGTIKTLYDPNSTWLRGFDTPISLRAKGCALLHKASALVARFESCATWDGQLEGEIQVASQAISNFSDYMSIFRYAPSETADPEGVRGILATASTAAHAAVVRIYEITSQPDSGGFARRHIACQNAISAVQDLARLDDSYIPLAAGITLSPIRSFITEALQGGVQSALFVDTDFVTLLCTIEWRIKNFSPAANDAW
ncbi:hypothetical protein BOTBODRAFT_613879 [Botryobasidium botryosum FD-172 SS1]|uniref:Zn(2)-C6 fungal-type domain-containing protein n=1 Tax=Botryobasidium botryosum (strain FD-172 SS1) TaxID=930990 RepID=A0A067LY34_BOTB1|nr:hypothetical protein BOTBODRAFT_613879 [Botryobasidium botryosum FD-172 SS1]